jgi:hypothetical protein
MKIRIIVALGAASLAALAQTTGPVTIAAGAGPEMVHAGGVFFQSVAPPMGGDVHFMYAEFGSAGKVVTGAPYSADVTTEHTQTLGDGNTIHTKQTGSVYRDGEGRTRRNQPLGAIGPLPMAPKGAQPVFINDPVAGVNYILDTSNKSAHKMPAPPPPQMDPMPHAAIKIATAGQPVDSQQIKSESLGTKTIGGVQAEGTRTVITIPAGEIGNGRPIEIVSERWYSSQLQTVVLSKHSDPRMGETTYSLTNIALAEPAHSLFEVPDDYQVVEGPKHFKAFQSK